MAAIGQARIAYLTSLYRHGARYPVSNVYDGNETKPFHGILTSIGMRQHYNLGSYIKQDYIDQFQLTRSAVEPKDVDIVSTSSPRCVESAYAQAAGIFPLEYGSKIPDGVADSFLLPPFAQKSPPSLSQDIKT